jgi:hypothetical protein
MMRFLKKYLKYSQAFDEEVAYEHFLSHLRVYKRSEALLFLSKLDAFLRNEGAHSPGVQNYLRDTFFKTWTASQIASKQVARRIPILFSYQQVLNLTKLVILNCSEAADRGIASDEDMEDFAKVCLKMNDFLEPEEKEVAATQEKDAVKHRMKEFFIKNMLLHAHYRPEYMIPRYHKLFLEIPTTLSNSSNYVDIKEEFKGITGIDLSVYVAIGIITITHLMRINRDTLSQENIPVAIDKKTYYSNVKSNNEQIQTFLKQACLPIANYKSTLESERNSLGLDPKEYFEYSFLTMEKYPLVELEDGRTLCLSLNFMLRKITENIYWILLDGLPHDAKLQFLTFMGEVFQEYMASILKRVYGDRFVRLYYGKSQNEASDGIAVYPQELVFFEAKTSRLLLKTRRSGNTALFADDIRDVVVKGSKQLNKVIADFKIGRFEVNGFGAHDVKRYLPIIVTLVPFPQENLLWETYAQMLSAEGLFEDKDIERLSLIDIEELEMIEPILDEIDFLSILKKWHSTKELQNWSLNNYLYEKYHGSLKQNEELINQFKVIVDNCIALLKQDQNVGKRTRGMSIKL